MPSDEQGMSSRANATDLRKISPFGRNDNVIFLRGLCAFARDIPSFGCGSAVLGRYFSSYSLSASRRGSRPRPGVSARVTQLSFGAGGLCFVALPTFPTFEFNFT